jgi:hypothetical protein
MPHLQQYEFGWGVAYGKETVFNFFKNMKEINKLERIKNFYSDWKPSDIAFIKEMNWSKNNFIFSN